MKKHISRNRQLTTSLMKILKLNIIDDFGVFRRKSTFRIFVIVINYIFIQVFEFFQLQFTFFAA